MSLKIIKIIGIFIIFLLCFPLHFLYDTYPNFFTSIISPVNESIWEHMKLIYTSYILWGIVESFFIRKSTNNYFIQLFMVPIFGIIIYLTIYLPLFNIFGENLVISIVLLFIVIVLEQVISYFFLKSEEVKNEKIIGILGIILMYLLFAYLTYFPLDNYLFWDYSTVSSCLLGLIN